MADTSPLLALARTDPAAARARILVALTEVNGNLTHAADRLGVRLTTLRRCIDACAAGPEMEKRWPGRGRGGGVQSQEHRERLRESMRTNRGKRLVSPTF